MSDAMNELIDATLSANREKIIGDTVVTIANFILHFDDWKEQAQEKIIADYKEQPREMIIVDF